MHGASFSSVVFYIFFPQHQSCQPVFTLTILLSSVMNDQAESSSGWNIRTYETKFNYYTIFSGGLDLLGKKWGSTLMLNRYAGDTAAPITHHLIH